MICFVGHLIKHSAFDAINELACVRNFNNRWLELNRKHLVQLSWPRSAFVGQGVMTFTVLCRCRRRLDGKIQLKQKRDEFMTLARTFMLIAEQESTG